MTPNWSIVLIARNEARTLPKLLTSLSEFISLGGEVCLCDTGSIDGTPELARSLGCKVTEVGDKFATIVDAKTAKQLNKQFVIHEESPPIAGGDRIFDFSAARNFAATLALNDMVCMPDCDEKFEVLDVAKINELAIKSGRIYHDLVSVHHEDGSEKIKSIHGRFYNRLQFSWTGVVHEILSGAGKEIRVDEKTLKTVHHQNLETNRQEYLGGLMLDCYSHPNHTRNHHYLGRELLWTKRPKSALRILSRHVNANAWAAERGQSLIFMGDAYGYIGDPEKQAEHYFKAFHVDPTRREALIRLAEYYKHHEWPPSVAAFAAAALQIPWNPIYANNMDHYRHVPHELLYWAKLKMGDFDGAKEHIKKALEYWPDNSTYLKDLGALAR